MDVCCSIAQPIENKTTGDYCSCGFWVIMTHQYKLILYIVTMYHQAVKRSLCTYEWEAYGGIAVSSFYFAVCMYNIYNILSFLNEK